MNKKSRILLVYHDSDLVTYKTFELLASNYNHDITVAAPEGYKMPDGVELKVVRMSEIKSKFTRRAIFSLRKVIKDLRPDIIFAVSTSALSTAIWASVGISVKIVGYRGTQARVHKFDPTYRLALLNPRVDHIICETEDIKEYLSEYIKERKLSVKTKPYMLEWVTEAEQNRHKYENNANLQLCYVGHSAGRRIKGLHVLIDAMRKLAEKKYDSHLTVVGSVDDDHRAAASENVTFEGPRRDAVNYIAGADILVLPSLRDASPRVLREAQACGVPCIITDIPGARDLIVADGANQTGVLVPVNNSAAIAEAIIALGNNDEKRKKLGRNGKTNIKEHYNIEAYVKQFDDLINTLENETKR